MIRYAQNPALAYLEVSPDEVLAKGSHLEGYSLLINDETGRGLAASIVRALANPSTCDDIHECVGGESIVARGEVADFLEELRRNGAAISIGEEEPDGANWQAFSRFGAIDATSATYPITVVGGTIAASLIASLTELGLSAKAATWDDLGDLGRFQVVESYQTDRDGGTSTMVSDISLTTGVPRAENLVDGSQERLIVIPEGIELSRLYELNERVVRDGAAALFAQASGVEIAIGPYVVPGATACFWEYEHQRARSAFSYSEYDTLLRGPVSVPAVPRVTQMLASSMLVPFAVELALQGRSSLAGAVLRGRATTCEISRHNIMRLPRCPVCLPLRPLLRNALF